MKIIYTGAFRFPDKDAASQRVLNIGKIFRKIGYEVLFFGWEKDGKPEDLSTAGEHIYQGFKYFSQNELDRGLTNPFTKLSTFLFRGHKTLLKIEKYIKENSVDIIVAYNGNCYFLYKLQLLAKKNNIKLICDCTEWYEAEHLPGGKYGLANFDNNLRINKIYPLIKNVIVISSYLERHLDKLGCKTIVVPPLVDLDDKKWNPLSTSAGSDKIFRLIYAGDPGKKDLLSPLLQALAKINKFGRFQFILLGSDPAYIKKQYFANVESIPDYILIEGRVPMNDVPTYYKTADFSILLREDKRYAHAGFPTKLVESLSSGVPIITNDTSDVTNYIKNNYNGIILENYSVQCIIECLENLLLLSELDIKQMSINARKTSLRAFDFHNYTEKLKPFLKNLN